MHVLLYNMMYVLIKLPCYASHLIENYIYLSSYMYICMWIKSFLFLFKKNNTVIRLCSLLTCFGWWSVSDRISFLPSPFPPPVIRIISSRRDFFFTNKNLKEAAQVSYKIRTDSFNKSNVQPHNDSNIIWIWQKILMITL